MATPIMRPLLLALSLGLLSSAANAKPGLVGQYRIAEGPDAAGALEILANRRFRYFFSAGALDEQAQGRWVRRGAQVCLTTEPRPVPPAFTLIGPASGEGGEATLMVTGPNGRGIAGVDFVLGFDDGSTEKGYTQFDGWSMQPDANRKPAWVELTVAMYGLKSPRIALDGRAKAHVRLTPNDLGVVDFQGACFGVKGKHFVLGREGGEMRFVRAARR